MKLKKKQYYNLTYNIYDGRKIGFVTFQIQHKILMLKYLYISPEYRNQRYGEKVIDYLLSKANVNCIVGETLKSSRGFWRKEIKRLNGVRVNTKYCDNTTSAFIIPKMKIDDLYGCLCKIYNMLD